MFGKRAGEYAAKFAKRTGAPRSTSAQARRRDRGRRWRRSTRRTTGENPFKVQHDLQEMMQDLVGIVRTEAEMRRRSSELGQLRERAARVGVGGHREYNPGWHTALDLRNLLTVSEAIARSAIERKESRGGHFREDYPDKSPSSPRSTS